MAKEVIISNSKLNSKGFRVLTTGIDTTQYLRNPVLLWQHNRPWRGTTDEILPIGKIENLRIDGDNLIGTPVFDESDEFAKQIKSKWDGGFLKMVSMGADVIETSDDALYILQGQRRATVTKCKLIEVSIVDIGANDDAIVLYKSGNIRLNSHENDALIPEIKTNFNNNEMKIIALKLGLPEAATEAEILTKIGTLQATAAQAENLQKQVDEQLTKAIEGAVDSAIKLKKITADKREHFVKLGKTSGIEVLTSTLEMLNPAAKPTDVINLSKVAETTDKKFSELSPEERIELRTENFEAYAKLYKAEYGIDIKI